MNYVNVIVLLLLLVVEIVFTQRSDCYVNRELRINRITDWSTQHSNVWFREDGTDRNVTAAQFTIQMNFCEDAQLGGGTLSTCARRGRVAIFDAVGACLEVFDQIASPIIEINPDFGSTRTVYESSVTNIQFATIINCNPSGQDTTIAAEEAVAGDRFLSASPGFINRFVFLVAKLFVIFFLFFFLHLTSTVRTKKNVGSTRKPPLALSV